MEPHGFGHPSVSFHSQAPPLVSFGLPLLGALLALVCLVFAMRAGRRRRLIDNIPTCKTTGVFIGLVELKGTAEAEQPLSSYLAGTRCVWYAWSVDEHWSRTRTETYTDSKGRTRTRIRHESGWTTVADGGEEIPFFLKDDHGVIRVQPHGAKIEPITVFSVTCGRSDPLYSGKGPERSVMNSDHRRRFTERAIPLHTPIYVMGQSRERDDIVAPEIAHDEDAPLFLISTRTERQVSSGMRWTFWGLLVLGFIPCLGAAIWRDGLMGFDPGRRIAVHMLVGLGYVLACTLGWMWMVYNSMVDLRQRVRQAWSNVDVQLKRRADLIPSLVRAVEGMRDHERNLQAAVAKMRAQLSATPPGQAGPDFEAVSKTLLAVVERYPALKANDSFMNLQENLIDTEQRIALARGYFNDIATFYNTRLRIVPDRFIAAMASMQPQPLMAAADFERAPVKVSLAT